MILRFYARRLSNTEMGKEVQRIVDELKNNQETVLVLSGENVIQWIQSKTIQFIALMNR